MTVRRAPHIHPQRRLDALVERETRGAMARFISTRVPEINYVVTFTVDVTGDLVLTWSPRP